MKNKINILSEDTIIKIAAGEIIENPSSVIKELVENSIDAGSNKISIEIKNNGESLIKVSDNGVGFNKDDLKIAFKRHTTSKIRNIEDLEIALSLGFRGEALSSIANASKVTIITKTKDDIIGIKADIDHNGNVIDTEEIVTNDGTSIFCENLFENLPVRKTYLKNKNFEISKTIDIVNRLALSHTDISFEFIKDGKMVLKTDKDNDLIDNIYSVLGRDISENLKYIEYKSDKYFIRGYISNNNLYKSNRNSQFIFVNSRSVVDREISKAIEKQYYSMIPLNRYPVFILYIDMDSRLLDVNIHPKKDIIKFNDSEDLLNTISLLFRKNVRENLIIPEVSSKEILNKETIFEKYKDNKEDKISDIFLNKDTETKSDSIISFSDLTEDYIKNNNEESILEIEENILKNDINIVEDDFFSIEEDEELEDKVIIFKNGYRYIGNLFSQYLLIEDNINKELYILDQHAAHERINYERLVKEYENKNISVQHLIDSYIIELTSSEFETIMELKETFNDIGIEIEEFGINSIIVRGVPAYINNIDPERLVRELLESEEIKNSVYDANPYLLMKKACTSSIKTGHDINPIDAHKLIEQLKTCNMPLTCPHGRPTMIRFSKKELDKEFFRIQNER